MVQIFIAHVTPDGVLKGHCDRQPLSKIPLVKLPHNFSIRLCLTHSKIDWKSQEH